ncbi:MAG: DEAD/DEAH box helicase family protein, partial [Desulfobacterales bacterium]|nr:DEAD/DEAH box helicase family protein [Desulfobacterales bacterium]
MTTDREKVLPIQLTLKDRLRITGMPEDLRNEVMEKLSFDNPKWIENHRMGRWNRGTPKILKFYAKAAGHALIVPRGYIRQIIHLCHQHSATYEIADHRRVLTPVAYCFSGSLRPYQQTAVNRMLKKDFGTMSAPTGSGKTIMALYMIAMRQQPALVVVHTKELAFQWIERIAKFLGLSENEIGFIGDGKRRVGGIITVALVQSLYRCVDEVFKQTGHLIVDECHRIPSRTFTEAVIGFDCKYMLGLSATPWRRDGLSRLIFWHLGGVHHEMDAEQLIEEGAVLKAEVVVRETEFK